MTTAPYLSLSRRLTLSFPDTPLGLLCFSFFYASLPPLPACQTFYNCGPMDVLDDQQGFTNFSYYPRLCNLGVVPNGGSGVIFRRAALNQLGGFATESLGEDYLTSFYCQLNGW